MLQVFLRFRGVLFNLLFLGYLALVQPLVLRRLDAVLDRGAADPLLGVLLLAVPWLELAGLYLKAPPALERLRQKAVRWPSSLTGLVWMAHLVMNVMMFVGFACFGVDSGDDPPLWGVLLMAAVVLKELFFLLYWTQKVEPVQIRGTGPSPYPARPWWSEQVGELLLLPFALLSFSCLWELLVARNPIHYSSPGDAALELGLAVFVFLLLFAASRSLYVIEEWATLRGKWPVLVWALSILLNLALALAFLPAG